MHIKSGDQRTIPLGGHLTWEEGPQASAITETADGKPLLERKGEKSSAQRWRKSRIRTKPWMNRLVLSTELIKEPQMKEIPPPLRKHNCPNVMKGEHPLTRLNVSWTSCFYTDLKFSKQKIGKLYWQIQSFVPFILTLKEFRRVHAVWLEGAQTRLNHVSIS